MVYHGFKVVRRDFATTVPIQLPPARGAKVSEEMAEIDAIAAQIEASRAGAFLRGLDTWRSHPVAFGWLMFAGAFHLTES